MFVINSLGQANLSKIVEVNNTHKIARNLIEKFPWLTVAQSYQEFYIRIEKNIEKLNEEQIKQENCIVFHLDLLLSLGINFLNDSNYLWLKKFYEDNDYLPELDFTNKLNDYLDDYFINVIGGNKKYLKKAIKNLSMNKQKNVKDIYPEKYEFLKSKNVDLRFYDNCSLLNNLEFVFGVSFLKMGFFSKTIINENELLKKMVDYNGK